LDFDLDSEQLTERKEQATLQRGEGHDIADARSVMAADDLVTGKEETIAGVIEKKVPTIMKNQRPTICCRTWSADRCAFSSSNRAISYCWRPNAFESTMPETERVSSTITLMSASVRWVVDASIRRTFPTL
jgi:hypothetical protein